jgi:hypothetical protein
LFGVARAIPCGLIAFLLPVLTLAAPPEQEISDRSPLAPLEVKAEHLATLSITAPCTPQVGPWSALGAVYTGASLEPPVWDLRGIFSTKPGRIHVGASSLYLTGFGPSTTTPLMELVVLQAGEHRDCWHLIDTDKLRPFPRYFLTPGIIRDRDDIHNGTPEVEAFWQVLVQAHFTSTQAFAKAARRDVTYVHLFNEPEIYRGEVVHLSGRLLRLRQFKAPDEARAAGVAHLYEAWIMTDQNGENPICFAFTDLPAGLKVDNERKYNDPVGCDGYFYKRFRYKAADSKKPNEFRDAPLLIGHSLTGRFSRQAQSVPDEDEVWGHNLIWVFLSVIGGTLVGVIVVTVWFRYHDRRVRRRIHASRHAEYVSPSEETV